MHPIYSHPKAALRVMLLLAACLLASGCPQQPAEAPEKDTALKESALPEQTANATGKVVFSPVSLERTDTNATETPDAHNATQSFSSLDFDVLTDTTYYNISDYDFSAVPPPPEIQVREKTPPKTAAVDKKPKRKAEPKRRKKSEPKRLQLPKDPAKRQAFASRQFDEFARAWVNRVNSNYRATASRKELVQRGETFAARYMAVAQDSLEVRIKPSTSRTTPYVGVLRYIQETWECPGDSPESARNAQCTPVKRVRVTEIFRYERDHWAY